MFNFAIYSYKMIESVIPLSVRISMIRAILQLNPYYDTIPYESCRKIGYLYEIAFGIGSVAGLSLC